MSSTISGSGIQLSRVEGLDGSSIRPTERTDLDVGRFARFHGRSVLDGEYGCYMSHLAALRRVADGDHPVAIVTEDDIGFTRGLAERVSSLFSSEPRIELLKLMNHRVSGFVPHGRSELGDEFGRCIHGPQGSAACYAVTREGAQKLIAALKPMWLPYDIAFERGWSTGVATYTTRTPLVDFLDSRADTTIGTSSDYRQTKLPKIRQIPTALFRGADYVARSLYAYRKL